MPESIPYLPAWLQCVIIAGLVAGTIVRGQECLLLRASSVLLAAALGLGFTVLADRWLSAAELQTLWFTAGLAGALACRARLTIQDACWIMLGLPFAAWTYGAPVAMALLGIALLMRRGAVATLPPRVLVGAAFFLLAVLLAEPFVRAVNLEPAAFAAVTAAIVSGWLLAAEGIGRRTSPPARLVAASLVGSAVTFIAASLRDTPWFDLDAVLWGIPAAWTLNEILHPGERWRRAWATGVCGLSLLVLPVSSVPLALGVSALLFGALYSGRPREPAPAQAS